MYLNPRFANEKVVGKKQWSLRKLTHLHFKINLVRMQIKAAPQEQVETLENKYHCEESEQNFVRH